MRKQAFSQTLKTGHPEGMLSHKIFKRLSELSLYFFQKGAFIGCLDTLLAKTLRGRHVAFGILLLYFCFSLLRLQFQPSLCRLLTFLFCNVTVSRPCCLLKFTLTGPQRRNKVWKEESLCIVFSLTEKGPQAFPPTKYSYNHCQKCWEGYFFYLFIPLPQTECWAKC